MCPIGWCVLKRNSDDENEISSRGAESEETDSVEVSKDDVKPLTRDDPSGINDDLVESTDSDTDGVSTQRSDPFRCLWFTRDGANLATTTVTALVGEATT